MEDAETMMASNPTNSLAKEKETASNGGKFTFISYRYAKILILRVFKFIYTEVRLLL